MHVRHSGGTTTGRAGGFTLLELTIVVAIIAITAAFAVPSFRQMQADAQLRSAAREVANAYQYARTQAIQTETVHIVYLAAGVGTDICGNNLQDPAGNPVPIAILTDNDGDCCIDPGETLVTEQGQAAVFWGATFAGGAVGEDSGAGDYTTGSSFSDQFGAQARWVAFRPDGVPVGFSNACVLGQTGTGRGAAYLTNSPAFSNRDYAVVLSPLGSSKIYSFDRAAGAWTN